ncbi:MAG: non-heme iron oxygenase ferredoxin subunit [Planctomycetota bacterium]
MDPLIKIAETNDVPAGSRVRVDVEGRTLVLFNIDGKYYAIDDACPHNDASLAEGDLEGNVITCPWHAAQFDVTTGEAMSPPAPGNVASYKVHVDGGDISIDLS